MYYYKIVDNGYIMSIGLVEEKTNNTISENEYNKILSTIRSKPPATETTDYRLMENLTWKIFEIDPPDPNPEINDSEFVEMILEVIQ